MSMRAIAMVSNSAREKNGTRVKFSDRPWAHVGPTPRGKLGEPELRGTG